jgi:hypothetical protein
MRPHLALVPVMLLISLAASLPAADADSPWTDLNGLDTWKSPSGAWAVVGEVHLRPGDPKHLAASPGEGTLYNGPAGRTTNLISKQAYGDVELQCEFFIPKGSNSGIKFQGVYEIQIIDSYGKAAVDGGDCGGIYPRAELLPTYHHIDEGHPPKVNASKPAGEWQTLDIAFRAPRFDSAGKKTANARFEKVVLNGQVIHQGVDAESPTGNNWRKEEQPTGPLLLQADHGPVAFRKMRARTPR